MALFIPGRRARSEVDRSHFDESASLSPRTRALFCLHRPLHSSTWLNMNQKFIFWYTAMICASGCPFCPPFNTDQERESLGAGTPDDERCIPRFDFCHYQKVLMGLCPRGRPPSLEALRHAIAASGFCAYHDSTCSERDRGE
jgi:hypothetical protein